MVTLPLSSTSIIAPVSSVSPLIVSPPLPITSLIFLVLICRTTAWGAFVTIMPGRDGLVHVSEISEERVENVSDYFVEGEEVKVKVLEVDRQGKIRLTMKGLDD